MKTILYRFSEAATRHGFDFSRQELLKNGVIGLDSGRRKLLWIFEQEVGVLQERVICLEALTCCSIKKDYSSIQPGSLPARRLDEYLLRIYLHLEGKAASECAEIPFYDFKTDRFPEAAEAERKARLWASLIAPLLTSTIRRA